MAWVLGLTAVVSLSLLAASLRFLFRDSRKALALDRRLQAVRKQAVAAFGAAKQRSGSRTGRAVSVWSLALPSVSRIGAMVVPIGESERVKLSLLIQKAGFYHRDALAFFLSAKLVMMLTGGATIGFLVWWGAVFGGHPVATAISGLVGVVSGGLLPEVGLRRLIGRRKMALSGALPDALDLMVLCVEAGYTFEHTLSMVSRELRPLSPTLARELASVEAELRAGSERRGVLEGLYERTEADGIRDFSMTVIQAERYGTPIGQSIQNIAASERIRRSARMEAQAGRLPVLMSLPMLLLVVPGVLLLLGGPAFMRAMEALEGLG